MEDTALVLFPHLARLMRRLRSSGIALFPLAFPALVLGQSTGGIRGIARDSLGGVVSNAAVSLKGVGAPQTTDSTGAFRLVDVPAGDALLQVRRLGYRPASIPVSVPAGGEISVTVTLQPVAEQLAAVQIRSRAEAYDSRLAGFNARKSKHVGYFVTREQLDRMNSARFIDAIREMPGVSMRTLRGGVVTVSLRGAHCAPMFYMDGFPATAGAMDLDMIDLSGVEGIEVYSGMTGVPSEFMAASGSENCGVIAVWSRPFRPKPRNKQRLSRQELQRLIAERTVFTADQVSQPAALIGSGSTLPVYPDSLWSAGISGRVVAEFIVDQDGQIEPGSVAIASATHPYFANAVRVALEGDAFSPALLNGKPVRQLVDLPFQFEPAATNPDTIPPRP